MKIAVIIPMHNLGEITDRCVDTCIRNAGIDHDIFIIDDFSSTPYANDKVKAVIKLKEHSGFTRAVNVGLRMALAAGYEYFCLLNNDTIPEPNFLKALLDLMHADRSIGVCGSTRITSKEPYREAGAGADLTTGTVYYADKEGDFLEPLQSIWIPFCCVMMSRESVQYIGLLDEKMIMFCSDNDYCLRALFMGFGVVLQPASKVFHYQSATWQPMGLQPYDDQITFAKKWFGIAMNEILDKIPVNLELNKFGKIGFKYEVREKDLAEGFISK